MADVLDWQRAPDKHDLIRCAAHALSQGALAALPTDTGYALVASILAPEAVDRLVQLQTAPAERPLTLALFSDTQAPDWVPGVSPLGRRLARRCWPGPVTLLCSDEVERGVVSRLSERVRQRVCPEGSLALRVPGHAALLQALALLPAPLALTSAWAGTERKATTAEEVQQVFGDKLAVIVDAGPIRAGQTSSVVRVKGNTWSMVREGMVSAEEVRRQTTTVILFVCTGNTCRSPMAEAICTQLLTARLQCSPPELPGRGFLVSSAGLAAMPGDQAALEAMAAVKEHGADLSGHSSQPLTPDLVLQADYLFTMTRSHQVAVQSRFGGHGPRPRLLHPEGMDIADPIGADQEVYRECAQEIRKHIEQLLPELHPENATSN